MNLILAPLFALFNAPFYRQVQKSRVSQGILYMIVLSLVTTLIMIFAAMTRLMPAADQFMRWVQQDMPRLTWTPEGLVMDAQSPYIMVHPELGPLMSFDTTIQDITIDEMGDVMMFVTARRLYVRQGLNQVRTYDLMQPATQLGEGERAPQAVSITPDLVQQFYDSLKPWVLFIGAVFFFVLLVIWKLLVAFLYAWVGLLINFMRRSKLGFGQIYNTTLFAMTAAIVIQWLRLLVPPLSLIPFGILGSIAVTVGYLFFAVKFTEEKGAGTPPGVPGQSTS